MNLPYPPIKPYNTGFLQVSKLHSIYYEESGNPKGIPILRIHGGPGGSSSPDYRQLYNPKKYRIILFDQRGCGKSKPFGELRENTTQDLIEDIEKLRKHLRIEKWIVSGGSWGSCLALAYSELHPTGVKALILNSIFLFSQREIDWIHGDSVRQIYPEIYKQYSEFIPENERNNLFEAYRKRIVEGNIKIQGKAAQMLSYYDHFKMSLRPKITHLEDIALDNNLINNWKIYFYYAVNQGFLEKNSILSHIKNIQNIPGIIIQGRYDMQCPLITAWELHKAWPKAQFEIVVAGHRTSEPAIIDKIIEYTDNISLKIV